MGLGWVVLVGEVGKWGGGLVDGKCFFPSHILMSVCM